MENKLSNLCFKVGSVKFDNREGIGLGATFLNQSIDYFGLIAWMYPNTFLSLVPKIVPPNEKSKGLIKKAIKNKRGIACPLLEVEFNILGTEAKVIDHEGRHRCMVLKELQPDLLVPIYIVPVAADEPLTIRGLTSNHIKTLSKGIKSEDENGEVIPIRLDLNPGAVTKELQYG